MKQPDLNWENPRVRAEVFDMMRWWLDKGIDGFRMDVINMISKVPGLPDAPAVTGDRYQFGGQNFIQGPRLLEFLQEMKQEVLSKYDILTVGETPLTTPEQAVEITDEETGVLSMVFQFEHMDLDADRDDGVGNRRQAVEPGGSEAGHDALAEGAGGPGLEQPVPEQPRPAAVRSRASATMAATGSSRPRCSPPSCICLQGTPYIYQGEEIGMTNVAFESIEDYRDIATLNMYREAVDEHGVDPQLAMMAVHARSRDNARTPMQWDAGAGAGLHDRHALDQGQPELPDDQRGAGAG